MEQAKDYKVIVTNENILVFLIKTRKNEPQNPLLIYEHGRHAVFHRSEDEAIIFDWLDESLLPTLNTASHVLIFETDDSYDKVFLSYQVPVKHNF